jgi:YegS/Rv2252/BmrU family lipid kinase
MNARLKKWLIIHNPHAGSGKNVFNEDHLKKKLNSSLEYKFMSTTAPHHATQIVESEKQNYDSFIAVGGDGTVNEVGKALVNSDKSLGIIPTGSGNGLALELGIEKSLPKALDLLIRGNEKKIDTLQLNDDICLNVAGVGFDAEVAHHFDKYKSRGFLTYVFSTLRTIFHYRPITLKLKLNGEQKEYIIFSVSFANSRQFGNNAYIAPLAQLDDGLMDIAMIRPFPLYQIPFMALRLFTKSLPKSRYYTYIRAKKVELLEEKTMNWHIDGEPVRIKGPVTVQVKARSLRVIGE